MDENIQKSSIPAPFVREESLVEKVKNILSASKYFTGLTAILLVVGLVGGVYLSQQNSDNRQHAAANTMPPDGMAVYDACGTGCLDHLKTFAQEGFKEVLDYSNVASSTNSIAKMQQYATEAGSDNIKIIWSLKDTWTDKITTFNSSWYGSLLQECGCSDKWGLAKYVVDTVKSYPSTWGYYIADEPTSGDFTNVQKLYNLIRQEDPNPSHLILIVKNDSLGNGNPQNVSNNLPQFASVADVLAEDYYPVSYHQDITQTGPIAKAVQSVADSVGKQSGMVLEVNSDNGSGILPSTTDMEEMLTLTLQNANPKLVLWYWYSQTSSTQWNNLLSTIMYATSGNTSYHECAKAISGGCGSTYPYFTDVTVVKVPTGSGGYSYTCTNPQTASPSECSYPATESCSNHGGLKQQYPQCSRTVGGCDQDFASGVLLQVQHCNDGTYLCPANLAQVVAGQCGIPGNTPTPTIIPSVTPSVSPSPTPTPLLSPTPTPPGSYHQCSQTIGGCAMNYPYFDDLTILKTPNGTGGYTYACTSPVLASPGECSYPDAQSCSSHGGLTNQYPQCAKSIGGCDQNFEKGVLLTVQHCNDGTYLCPANLAKVVPGQCGVAMPTPTDSMSPAPSDSPSPSGTQLVGDINGDGVVDILDYNILNSCYNVSVSSPTSACPNPKAADLDGSGVVDGVDYNILLRAMAKGQ